MRHTFYAARRRVLPAVLTAALCAPPTALVLAKAADDAPAKPAVPQLKPALPDGVFQGPGGVIMMAPIPDKQPAPVPGQAQTVTSAPLPQASPPANSGDIALLKQAFVAAGRDWNRARLLAAQAGEPIGRLIVEWRYLLDESSGAYFENINAFLKEHPNWPRHDALTIRAEKTMPVDMSASQVVAWYGNRAPLSGMGMIRLGDALIATGRRDEGAALIRKGWTQFTFSPFDENQIMSTQRDYLRAEDQKARLDQLLSRDDIGGANRQLARVDTETKRMAALRMKVKASPSVAAARAAIASSPSAGNDPELLFEAARALRRSGQNDEAWALMAQAPGDKYMLANPERWSVERGIMARDALKAGKVELAYQFASTPALDADSGATFMDAEFLAGWIALEFLHKPDVAQHHFDRLAKGVVNPISVARAHYWLGRAAEAMLDPLAAIAEYQISSQHSETFYGQLSMAKIAPAALLHINAVESTPTPAERAAFDSDERVRAIRLLAQLADRGNIRTFALGIVSDTQDPHRLQMLAELVRSTGDPAMSVRVAKNASYAGVNLPGYLHPVIATPALNGGGPEPALVLGLARQESEFDPTAVSTAGAKGLMQLMPASAKRAASMRGLAYRERDLTDPSYNMQLGMTTLADYLERWNGSYVLGIASYNAGPGNVSKWVDAYGDPRDSGVDPIDWIESIPFPETRNYVQRVLENLEVYRNRLSNSDQQLRILADLYRPNGVELAVAKALPVAGAGEATVTPASATSVAPGAAR